MSKENENFMVNRLYNGLFISLTRIEVYPEVGAMSKCKATAV